MKSYSFLKEKFLEALNKKSDLNASLVTCINRTLHAPTVAWANITRYLTKYDIETKED